MVGNILVISSSNKFQLSNVASNNIINATWKRTMLLRLTPHELQILANPTCLSVECLVSVIARNIRNSFILIQIPPTAGIKPPLNQGG